jgi:hypothetical protein
MVIHSMDEFNLFVKLRTFKSVKLPDLLDNWYFCKKIYHGAQRQSACKSAHF